MTDRAAFEALDLAISQATSGDRPGLIVGLAARLAQLGAGLTGGNGDGRPVDDPGDDDRLLTYPEAAEWLRASKNYVALMVRQGKLQAVTLPATAKGTGAHRRERAGRMRRIRLFVLRAFADRLDTITVLR